MGIDLLEASIETSHDLAEAAHSLISRGIDAFWVGCDNIVNTSIPIVAGIAQSAKIPVFSNIAGHMRQGSFFDLGANYYEVGIKAADISADVLAGKSPKDIPVVNYMPQKIAINKYEQANLKGSWNIPEDFQNSAFLTIDQDNEIIFNEPSLLPEKQWNIELIQYLENPMSEQSVEGIKNELTKAGLKKGKNYKLKIRSAQGDISALPALFDAAEIDGTDFYFVLSTPTLQTAVNKIKYKPVVFTMVADPFAAHAGESNDKHLPNVTGVYTVGPYKEGLALLVKHFTSIKKLVHYFRLMRPIR
ncbi:MAG: hypothetical protein IT292_08295 [Deltaproteobacteria bacterium]|nr:hypothetical protein [Deltaproteobacteria bacterium]